MSFETMYDLLVDELQDIYSAENQLVKALPTLAKRVHTEDLAEAIRSHFRETEQQLARLEEVFDVLDAPTGGKTCHAMKGLLQESDELLDADGGDAVLDAGLIMTAQKVEHYEIAAYGCAIAHAKVLGETEVAELLERTLEEEKSANETLTGLAESSINLRAAGREVADE